MSSAAEIEALARMAPEIFQREGPADDGLRLQSFEFFLGPRFAPEHSNQVLLERQFARHLFADRTNPNGGLRIADCGLRGSYVRRDDFPLPSPIRKPQS